MFTRHDFKDRHDWLQGRLDGIGGSSVSAIVGLNPYKTNRDLWEQIVHHTYKEEKNDAKKEAILHYGSEAEKAIRFLFQLKYENYLQIFHKENQLLTRNDKPYLMYSPDGEILVLQDCSITSYFNSYKEENSSIEPQVIHLKKGMRGILEIKTSNIMQSYAKEKWNNKIPENYYCQVLQGLIVSGYDFFVLVAELEHTDKNNVITFNRRMYCSMRADVLNDLKYLEEQEDTFWNKYVIPKKEPPVRL